MTSQKNLYQCPECGFHYQDTALAKKCEAWCREHKSCSIEITTYAIENKKDLLADNKFMTRKKNYIANQESDWEEIRHSENFKLGVIANKGQCPCEQKWTGDDYAGFFDHDPSEEEIKACLEKTKEPTRPSEPCADDCQWILKEEWKDWRVYKHKKENRYFVSAWWIRQWHCERVESKIPT